MAIDRSAPGRRSQFLRDIGEEIAMECAFAIALLFSATNPDDLPDLEAFGSRALSDRTPTHNALPRTLPPALAGAVVPCP